MDPSLLSPLLSGLVGNGLPSLLMAAAIWWLQRSQERWIGELSKERVAHMDSLERRCDDLEKRSDECERDRIDLRNKLLTVLSDQVKCE